MLFEIIICETEPVCREIAETGILPEKTQKQVIAKITQQVEELRCMNYSEALEDAEKLPRELRYKVGRLILDEANHRGVRLTSSKAQAFARHLKRREAEETS